MENITKRFSIMIKNLLHMHSKKFKKSNPKNSDNKNLISIKIKKQLKVKNGKTKFHKETLKQRGFWWYEINIIVKNGIPQNRTC